MKKIRLTLIFVMLICITLVACGKNEKSRKKIETESTKDTSEYFNRNYINTNIISKYSKNEIQVYSYEDCYFCLPVLISDGDYLSSKTYGPFFIKKEETQTFTINDLNPNAFSKNAYIKEVSFISPFVYDNNKTNVKQTIQTYNNNLVIKYTENEIIINSDYDCTFDLWLSTQGNTYDSTNIFRNLKIKKDEPLKLMLKYLGPEKFFESDDKIIYASTQNPYVEQ